MKGLYVLAFMTLGIGVALGWILAPRPAQRPDYVPVARFQARALSGTVRQIPPRTIQASVSRSARPAWSPDLAPPFPPPAPPSTVVLSADFTPPFPPPAPPSTAAPSPDLMPPFPPPALPSNVPVLPRPASLGPTPKTTGTAPQPGSGTGGESEWSIPTYPKSDEAGATGSFQQSGRFHVQAGVFSDREGAQALMHRLQSLGYLVTLDEGDGYRVWVGGYIDRVNAERLAQVLREAGFDATLTP